MTGDETDIDVTVCPDCEQTGTYEARCPVNELVWIRDKRSGRLEREQFGVTPFTEVPSSPYYTPSPGSFLSARAWMDEDGQHVVIAHDCVAHRVAHILPWPTWQAVEGSVDPSYDCGTCGLHSRTSIDWEVEPVLTQVAERRQDAAFMTRIQERVQADKPLLDGLTRNTDA